MASAQAGVILRHIHALVAAQRNDQLPDRQLVERFAQQRDEAAFAALVRRHGPMVLRICRRVLDNWHDAEDVFQAVFLTLARKASSIRKRASVGCWLHGVASRPAPAGSRRGTQEAEWHAANSQPVSYRPGGRADLAGAACCTGCGAGAAARKIPGPPRGVLPGVTSARTASNPKRQRGPSLTLRVGVLSKCARRIRMLAATRRSA